jgi:hypothetical protein
MYELLKRVEKVEERDKVLRQISRISGVIESLIRDELPQGQGVHLDDMMNLTAKVRMFAALYLVTVQVVSGPSPTAKVDL